SVHAGVDAHTGPAGPAQGGYGAGGGQELPVRVLPVEPELEAVPVRGDFGVPQRLTGGDAELLAHQVDPGDLLADAVLHLQASVDLQEGNGPVGADEELAGSCPAVAGLGEDRLGGGVQLFVLFGGQERG